MQYMVVKKIKSINQVKLTDTENSCSVVDFCKVFFDLIEPFTDPVFH